MTNAEKYLKDGVKEQLIKELSIYGGELDEFFEEQVKPKLTEDERVILRNIKNDDYGKYIGRGGSLSFKLYLRGNDESRAYAIGTLYNHLFQFIKNGEEYEIKELLDE